MTIALPGRENQLLAMLPPDEWQRLQAHLDYYVELPLGHVYFPTSTIVLLLYVMEDCFSAEIAMVGNEGLIGVSLFIGGDTAPSHAVVLSADL